MAPTLRSMPDEKTVHPNEFGDQEAEPVVTVPPVQEDEEAPAEPEPADADE